MLNFLKSNIQSPLVKNLYNLYKTRNFLKLKEEISKNLEYLTSEKGIKELKQEIEKNSKASDIGFLWALFVSIIKEIYIIEQTKNQLIETFDIKQEKTKNHQQNNKEKEINEKLVLSTISSLAKGIKEAYKENEKLKEEKAIWKSNMKEYSDLYKLLIKENLLNKASALDSIQDLIRSHKALNKFIKYLEKEQIIIKVNNGFYEINPAIKYQESKIIKTNKNYDLNLEYKSPVIKDKSTTKAKKYEFKDLETEKNNEKNSKDKLNKLEKKLKGKIKKLEDKLKEKEENITKLEKKVKELENKLKQLEEKQKDDIDFKIKILEAEKAYKGKHNL